MLVAEQISYAIRDGEVDRHILSNLTFEFPQGAITSVTGPSGAGKTTLLSILSLIVEPTSGKLYFANECLTELSNERRQEFREVSVGIVFQTARVLARLTLDEQIRFTAAAFPKQASTSEAWCRAERLGISSLADKIPAEMSGGEKQRTALVLALMKRPSIVLADEPTAALDGTSSQFMADELRDYCTETMATVVAVTHDQALVRTSDRQIKLGEIP